jgi:hypothetical protein
LSDSSPQIIWWEGDFTPRDFSQFSLSQRISKIPGMDYLCYKSTTIYALNQMRRMFPAHYRFFPASFILPQQFSDLRRAHLYLQEKTHQPVTWIAKPRNDCCGHGIKLVPHIYSFLQNPDPLVIQRYVSPFLIDGFKFDFRFYLLISSLAPYTVYIYRDWLALSATKKYKPPRLSNHGDRFSHLTNTAVNKENPAAVGQCLRDWRLASWLKSPAVIRREPRKSGRKSKAYRRIRCLLSGRRSFRDSSTLTPSGRCF